MTDKLYFRKQVRLSVLDTKELFWKATLIIKIQRKFLKVLKSKIVRDGRGT